jgi:hypothetical protein
MGVFSSDASPYKLVFLRCAAKKIRKTSMYLPQRFKALSLSLILGLTPALGGCNNATSNGNFTGADGDFDPDDGEDNVTSVLGASETFAVESGGSLLFVLPLVQISEQGARVSYRTVDDTALAGSDYTAVSGELLVPAGSTEVLLSIPLIDDGVIEAVEQFHLLLENPVGLALDKDTIIVTLLDDDRVEFDASWSHPESEFAGAHSCGQCHTASRIGSAPAVLRSAESGNPSQPSPNGEDISPMSDWRHSLMAHAFNDPYYRAVVADEMSEFPELAGLIEDTCLRCHAPMARWDAHQTGVNLDADGFLRFDTADAQMPAREGVSCTLCHQIENNGELGTQAAFSGQFSISDSKEITGPYANPLGQAMQRETGYTPVQAVHLSSSELCASCHNLYTPTIDVATGQPTGAQFLEQGPYFEWQNSVFATGEPEARECHECHQGGATEDSYASRIAVRPNGQVNTQWPERSPYTRHQQVGGNTQVLGMLQQFQEVLGIDDTTSAAGFQRQIDATRAQLQSETVELHVSKAEVIDGELLVDIDLRNLTGHKFPTSYPSRRAWLHLRVENSAGEVLFESGAPDANGRISVDSATNREACLSVHKPDGFDSTSCWEPHRDSITSADQVAIYEAVLGDTHGDITHVLLHAASYLKDNRIPPRGFSEDSAAFVSDTASAGVEGDADFNSDASGSDTVHYRIALSDSDTTGLRISAELLYQSIKPDFVGGLHSDEAEVALFKTMYRALPPTPERVSAISVSLD